MDLDKNENNNTALSQHSGSQNSSKENQDLSAIEDVEAQNFDQQFIEFEFVSVSEQDCFESSNKEDVYDDSKCFSSLDVKNFEENNCDESKTNADFNDISPKSKKNKKYFTCSVCNKKFVYKMSLSNHMKLHVDKILKKPAEPHKNCQCSVCNKIIVLSRTKSFCDSTWSAGEKSNNSSGRKRHMKCNDCNKSFTSLSQLEMHTRVHTGEKPYKCSTCQKTFSQCSILTQHKIIHTGEKPYECDICHRTFTQKTYLRKHKLCHTNDRPCQCSVCNKTFSRSDSLRNHMRSHTGDKPHQCHVCPYQCAYAGALRRHMRTHTGEKPHFCNICKRSFTQSDNLRQHNRRFHLN